MLCCRKILPFHLDEKGDFQPTAWKKQSLKHRTFDHRAVRRIELTQDQEVCCLAQG